METQIKAEGVENRVLGALGRFICMVFSAETILILSSIVAGVIGLVIYKIMGIPATFHMVWRWSTVLGIVPDPAFYLSGISDEHLIPVILSSGLGVFVAFLICWAVVRTKIKSEWKLLIEPWLLIMGQRQLFISFFIISDMFHLDLLMIGLLLLTLIIIPVFIIFYYYSERIKYWLLP